MTRKLVPSLILLLLAGSLCAQKRVEENFDFDWKFSKVQLPPPQFREMTMGPGGPVPVQGNMPQGPGAAPGQRPPQGQPSAQGGERPRVFRMPVERVDSMLVAEKGLEAPGYDDSSWETVQAPHDWNIKDEFDPFSAGSAASLPEGIGWYRKTFRVPASSRGRRAEIIFDGIFQKSDVWINGYHLGTHPYGYSTVHYDLTPYINFGGENTIAVRSSTVGGRPRWYGGGGIYRHVRLVWTGPVHVDTYGTYVTTPEVSSEKAVVNIVTTVQNASPKASSVSLSQRILDSSGREVAKASAVKTVTVPSGEKADIPVSLTLASPVLWDVDNPYMYTIETTVRSGGKVTDVYSTPFGVRYFEFDKDKGFSLNGRPLKLKGLAIHQDAGGLGSGVPDRSYERRLEIFKEYGCNALRMAHNQPSRELLDMCDRMGFLVIDEALDKWKSGYYEALFDDWWQYDLGDMILRDRNHPSIILWSIGNELQEAWNEDDEGVRRAAMLQDFVHGLEPSRPVCLAAQNNHQAHFAGVTDVIGYNYLEARAIAEHEIYPERRMLITEELPYWCGEEGNIRSYTPVNPWNLVRDHDFIAGGFIWSGVDYLGEASNPSKGWPNGLFDICMFEKPRASYHRAVWSEKPVVRVAVRDSGLDQDFGRDIWQWPSTKDDWTYPSSFRGRMMDIETVTNCEEVELYSGDRLMGRHKTSDFTNNTIVWHLPYQPGSLTAKGYIGGEMVAEHSIYTASEVSDFTVEPDRETLKADGQDLSHIVVTLVDEQGHRVQVDERTVRVEVTGGRLLAVDSGELRVTGESFARDAVLTQFGRVLAVVQSLRQAGPVTVRVTVEGLPPKDISLEAR